MDRPEDFRYAGGYGLVDQSYDTWHVDIRTVDGGLIQRAVVLGHRLPEKSTPERPQWVHYSFADHDQSQAACRPINSRMPGDRSERAEWIYYDEFGHFRITGDRSGVLEIRNSKSDLLQLRVIETDGVIELRVPDASFVVRQSDKSVTIDAAESVTINCKTATVNADENATVVAGADVSVQAGGNVSVEAGGSASVTAAGTVDITGALINLNGV